MHKHIAKALLLITIIAGCKKNDIAGDVPSCIRTEIENIKDDPDRYYIGKVSEYVFMGRNVYAFEPDDRVMDAGTAIKDSACNTICSVGGFGGPDIMLCNGAKFYDNAVFKRDIWKKK